MHKPSEVVGWAGDRYAILSPYKSCIVPSVSDMTDLPGEPKTCIG